MSFVIVLAALAFLMFAAYRGYSVILVAPIAALGAVLLTDPAAVAFLKGLRDAGKAEIGAHLHPWVTPPHVEEVTTRNSYHCNLPPALERAKIETLTATIEAVFGERPQAFKAGRYGFGPNTKQVLIDLGYEVDCSFVPHTDLSGDGGPDFRGVPDRPHWLDEGRGLLEIPLTVGYLGALSGLGEKADWLFDSPKAERLRVPGLLARTGLVARSRLTPEGTPPDEQCRLIEAMAARGHRLFSLTYHSPSLAPGHTPYVRDEADLAAFLASIEQVLTFFRDRMGGRFTTLSEVRRHFPGERAVA